MLNEFRNAYPKGSLISELLNIYQGKYVVRVLAIVDDVTLATGLAAEDTLEMAEDRARLRALSAIDLHPAVKSLDSHPVSSDRGSPDLSARASQSMATSSRSPEMAMSDRFGGTQDLSQDDSGAVVAGASDDRWLTSTPGVPLDLEDRDSQESIASKPDRPKSVASLDNDPIFAPVSGADVSALTGQTETGSVSTTELKTHPISEERVNPPSGESGTETNLLDPDERKTKIAESTIEIQRLNWTTQQGREFLQQRYSCRARSQLSDEQLLDFLHYLRTQPNPT